MVDLFARIVDSLECEGQEGVVHLRRPGWREAWSWHPVGLSQNWVLSGRCEQKQQMGKAS